MSHKRVDDKDHKTLENKKSEGDVRVIPTKKKEF